MKLDWFRHFEAVARCKSFVEAAELLHISQPALTRSVQAFERDLGGRVFDRRSQGIELTNFGIFVLERVRAILSSEEQLQREIELFKGVQTGELRVGFGPLPAETLAGSCIGAFIRQYPGIDLKVDFPAVDQMFSSISSGRIDVLVGDPRLGNPLPEVTQIALKARPGFFFCRKNHPLLQKQSLKFSDLTDYPFVGFRLDPPIAALFGPTRHFGRIDRRTGFLVPRIECDSVSTMKRVVVSSDAIGVATLSLIGPEVRLQLLAAIPLRSPVLKTGYSIFTVADRTPSPGAQAFIRTVIEVDNALAEEPPLLFTVPSRKQIAKASRAVRRRL